MFSKKIFVLSFLFYSCFSVFVSKHVLLLQLVSNVFLFVAVQTEEELDLVTEVNKLCVISPSMSVTRTHPTGSAPALERQRWRGFRATRGRITWLFWFLGGFDVPPHVLPLSGRNFRFCRENLIGGEMMINNKQHKFSSVQLRPSSWYKLGQETAD